MGVVVATGSLRLTPRQVQQRLGYCPQFDAIIEEMTGRETLKMFADLRGVPQRAIPAVVDDLTERLLLRDHIDKQVKQLRYRVLTVALFKEEGGWEGGPNGSKCITCPLC